jgi:hypothetical protein
VPSDGCLFSLTKYFLEIKASIMSAQDSEHKVPQINDNSSNSQSLKKSRNAHLYEPIIRSHPPPGTQAQSGNKFLSNPHIVDVIGVSFSAGQVRSNMASVECSFNYTSFFLDHSTIFNYCF